jgi:hypothetical protein
MRGPLRCLALLTLVATPPAAGLPGTWSVRAGAASGDWGGEVATDRQYTSLRYSWGDGVRLRAELDYVRVEAAGTLVAQTLFGPVSTGPGPKGPRGPGDGEGGSGPAGPPGGSTAFLTSADDAEEPQELETSRHSGLGDLRLSAARTLAGGGHELFRVDAEVRVKVPTADEEDYLGTGEWDVRLGAAGEYQLWTGTLFGGLGWNRLGDPAWAELADVLDAHAGFETDPLGGGVVLAGWIEANQEVLAGAGDRTAIGISARGRRRDGSPRATLA